MPPSATTTSPCPPPPSTRHSLLPPLTLSATTTQLPPFTIYRHIPTIHHHTNHTSHLHHHTIPHNTTTSNTIYTHLHPAASTTSTASCSSAARSRSTPSCTRWRSSTTRSSSTRSGTAGGDEEEGVFCLGAGGRMRRCIGFLAGRRARRLPFLTAAPFGFPKTLSPSPRAKPPPQTTTLGRPTKFAIEIERTNKTAASRSRSTCSSS